MIVRQIRSKDGTGTLSYLLLTPGSPNAILIDPNIEDLQETVSLIGKESVTVSHIIDTHTHADHISGAGELKKLLGSQVVMHENTKNKWKIVDQGDKFGIGDILRANAQVPIDQYVNDGDVITTGDLQVKMLFTAGHTDNHLTVLAEDAVFTGDLLLIGQAGRSDLPGGDPGEQYDSLFRKIVVLPDNLKMYPGHDYAGQVHSTIGIEKKSNPFLQKRTREEYILFVKDFFPPIAEAIASGGKMTLQCGIQRVAQGGNDVKEISPLELAEIQHGLEKPLIVDVREPWELSSIGAIKDVLNIPIGELASRMDELPQDKNAPIVLVCQSGARSLEAAHFLLQNGYVNVKSLAGGTGAWIKKGLSTVRPSLA